MHARPTHAFYGLLRRSIMFGSKFALSGSIALLIVGIVVAVLVSG